MKNLDILVPVDFSEPSKAALRAAGMWARMVGGKVTAIHAYEARTDLDGFHFYGPTTVTGNLATIATEVRRLLDEWLRECIDAAHIGGSVFREGHAALEIARESIDRDLIIISSHGRSGLSRILLGSVTDKVIRLAPTPVLIVPGSPARIPIRRVLVCTDLSPASATALVAANDLAAATSAELEVIHVYQADERRVADAAHLENTMRDFVKARRGSIEATVTVLVTGTSVHAAIRGHVHDKPADLIVMSTGGHGVSDRQLLGSTPSQVVRHVSTPILLVNPPEHAERRRSVLQ